MSSSPNVRYLRLADRPAAAGTPKRRSEPGLEPFAGLWATTKPSPEGVRRLQIATDGGEPSVRVLGRVEEGFVDWGWVPVAECFAGDPGATAVEGLTAGYDLGSVRCRLQVNLKLGVAVAGAFLELASGDRRPRLFTRDFLARPPGTELPPETAVLEPTAERLRRMLGTPAAPRLEPFAGRWLNTAAASAGIAGVEIAREGDDEVALRIFGAGPREPLDWGRVRGRAYSCVEEDEIASACILAVYDFDFMESELQIRINKGILALTTFNVFKDGSGRSSYAKRELFHR